ncbi:MAG: phosphonate C-P lyase system protein PhnH [Roseitalea porphyridii]|uniref:phosphonate C-P lyase system protein PhnH n=1 Tax=Roseitalea porphyridii TaxID=1852022 RepID=UPI0032EC2D1F
MAAAATPVSAYDGGLSDPVHGSQLVFRLVMNAMARPGTVHPAPALTRPPKPLYPVTGAVISTLADADTPVWLDPALAKVGDVRDWIVFHTGAPVTQHQSEAAFAVVAAPKTLSALNGFALGSQEYPDRSTTIVLQVETLAGGPLLTFEGPGIDGRMSLGADPLPQHFAAQWRANRKAFPRGVDLILAAPDCVAALPRSARLIVPED